MYKYFTSRDNVPVYGEKGKVIDTIALEGTELAVKGMARLIKGRGYNRGACYLVSFPVVGFVSVGDMRLEEVTQ